MTEDDLEKLLQVAKKYWLSGWYLLQNKGVCLQECNGMGPEWMPAWLRLLLSRMFELFAPAFAIHDMRYWQHKATRHKWDDELEHNCRVIITNTYKWYNPKRQIGYWAAHQIRVALAVGGDIAWIQAGKNNS